MRCVSMPGVPSELVSVPLTLLFSIVTRRTTVPASVICGVTERRSGTLMKVVVKMGVPPPELICGVTTGICEPDSICAGRLLRAVTRGVAMIFACPFCSAAVMSALICAVPISPVVRPMTVLGAVAPRAPVGLIMFCGTPSWRGPMTLEGGGTGAPGAVLRPPRPPREETASAFNCTPRSREKLRLARTMRVSISTCGSGWSSSSTRRRMASMFSRTSVTMSVFERPSTSTPPRRESLRWIIGRMPWSALEVTRVEAKVSPLGPTVTVSRLAVAPEPTPPAKPAVAPAVVSSVPAARA